MRIPIEKCPLTDKNPIDQSICLIDAFICRIVSWKRDHASGVEGRGVSVFLFAIWGALCFLLLPVMFAICSFESTCRWTTNERGPINPALLRPFDPLLSPNVR